MPYIRETSILLVNRRDFGMVLNRMPRRLWNSSMLKEKILTLRVGMFVKLWMRLRRSSGKKIMRNF